VHADFTTTDLACESERLLGPGATVIEEVKENGIRFIASPPLPIPRATSSTSPPSRPGLEAASRHRRKAPGRLATDLRAAGTARQSTSSSNPLTELIKECSTIESWTRQLFRFGQQPSQRLPP